MIKLKKKTQQNPNLNDEIIKKKKKKARLNARAWVA